MVNHRHTGTHSVNVKSQSQRSRRFTSIFIVGLPDNILNILFFTSEKHVTIRVSPTSKRVGKEARNLSGSEEVEGSRGNSSGELWKRGVFQRKVNRRKVGWR